MSTLDFETPILELEKKIADLENFSSQSELDLSEQLQALRKRCDQLKREVYANLTPWQRVQIAREPTRPSTSDFLQLMSEHYVELHGDRVFGDDPAIVCALAKVGDQKLMLIGHRRGSSTAERRICNFGSPHPEGYRKALRKMRLAEKFQLPIVTLINTPGAYPGIEAEERGQASAIAENLFAMARLRTPILCIVIGEGGSGGALGLGIADRLLILEHAYYSVISPEGCAAILWKEGAKAPEAAAALRLTPTDLVSLGIFDEIVPEPLGGAHRDHQGMADTLKQLILDRLEELKALPLDNLLALRYQKYRKIGEFMEEAQARLLAEAQKKAAEESETEEAPESPEGEPDDTEGSSSPPQQPAAEKDASAAAEEEPTPEKVEEKAEEKDRQAEPASQDEPAAPATRSSQV